MVMQALCQVFCSQAFLEQLENDRKAIGYFQEKEDDREAKQIWDSLIDFLCYSQALITVVVSNEHTLMQNIIFRTLSQGSTRKIKLVKNEDDIASKQPTTPYCFYFGLEHSRAKIEKWGFPKIESWKTDWQLFYSADKIKIAKSEDAATIWGRMQSYLQQPLHSLVIVDNYLLSSSLNIVNNLFRILSAMLSGRRLATEIHITIFTNQLYKNHIKGVEETLDNIYRKIEQHIRQKIGLRSFKLCLVKINSQDNHDRHIYTNCFVFRSGNSFNYFDKTGKVYLHSTTDFDVYPQPTRRSKKEFSPDYYHSELGKLAQILGNASYAAFGDRTNRLLHAHSV